jgi:hypothetical protein
MFFMQFRILVLKIWKKQIETVGLCVGSNEPTRLCTAGPNACRFHAMADSWFMVTEGTVTDQSNLPRSMCSLWKHQT